MLWSNSVGPKWALMDQDSGLGKCFTMVSPHGRMASLRLSPTNDQSAGIEEFGSQLSREPQVQRVNFGKVDFKLTMKAPPHFRCGHNFNPPPRFEKLEQALSANFDSLQAAAWHLSSWFAYTPATTGFA